MVFDPLNKPKGANRLCLAFINSCRALRWLYKNEAAFKQECALLLIAIPTSFLVGDNPLQVAILIISVLFILLMEVVNTVVEVIIDRIGLEIHPLSGLAKDLGSALVMMSMLISALVWLVICL